jgi:hypothetical protein
MADWREIRDQVEADYADYLDHPDFGADDGADGCRYPHCDDLVLHAPTAGCIYCNHYPKRQALRLKLNIGFTGQPHKVGDGVRPCPATLFRSVETIHRWHGNYPITEAIDAQQKAEWDALLAKYPDVLGGAA